MKDFSQYLFTSPLYSINEVYLNDKPIHIANLNIFGNNISIPIEYKEYTYYTNADETCLKEQNYILNRFLKSQLKLLKNNNNLKYNLVHYVARIKDDCDYYGYEKELNMKKSEFISAIMQNKLDLFDYITFTSLYVPVSNIKVMQNFLKTKDVSPAQIILCFKIVFDDEHDYGIGFREKSNNKWDFCVDDMGSTGFYFMRDAVKFNVK